MQHLSKVQVARHTIRSAATATPARADRTRLGRAATSIPPTDLMAGHPRRPPWEDIFGFGFSGGATNPRNIHPEANVYNFSEVKAAIDLINAGRHKEAAAIFDIPMRVVMLAGITCLRLRTMAPETRRLLTSRFAALVKSTRTTPSTVGQCRVFSNRLKLINKDRSNGASLWEQPRALSAVAV